MKKLLLLGLWHSRRPAAVGGAEGGGRVRSRTAVDEPGIIARFTDPFGAITGSPAARALGIVTEHPVTACLQGTERCMVIHGMKFMAK